MKTLKVKDYTDDELVTAYYSIDRDKYLDNFKLVFREIKKRKIDLSNVNAVSSSVAFLMIVAALMLALSTIGSFMNMLGDFRLFYLVHIALMCVAIYGVVRKHLYILSYFLIYLILINNIFVPAGSLRKIYNIAIYVFLLFLIISILKSVLKTDSHKSILRKYAVYGALFAVCLAVVSLVLMISFNIGWNFSFWLSLPFVSE